MKHCIIRSFGKFETAMEVKPDVLGVTYGVLTEDSVAHLARCDRLRVGELHIYLVS